MKKQVLPVAALLLSACFGGSDDSALDTTRTSQSGMRTSAELVQVEPEEPPMPAAIAGMIAGLHVSGASTSESLNKIPGAYT